jgi:hypothetical protein
MRHTRSSDSLTATKSAPSSASVKRRSLTNTHTNRARFGLAAADGVNLSLARRWTAAVGILTALAHAVRASSPTPGVKAARIRTPFRRLKVHPLGRRLRIDSLSGLMAKAPVVAKAEPVGQGLRCAWHGC